MAALAVVAPTAGDWLIIAGLFAFMGAATLIGGAAGRVLDWLDARRSPDPLTPEQIDRLTAIRDAEREALPWT
jgi:hypothetical protein